MEPEWRRWRSLAGDSLIWEELETFLRWPCWSAVDSSGPLVEPVRHEVFTARNEEGEENEVEAGERSEVE